MQIRTNSVVSVDKWLLTLGFVLLFPAAMIIARTPSVTGYEISIYQAYPFYFWVLIIGSLICGTIILIKKSLSSQNRTGLSLGAYILLVFTNVIIILLPLFRGYFIRSQGDEITHLGWIVDIINTGHAGSTNIYPISHILTAQLSLFGGVDIKLSIIAVSLCFYLLYALGLLLLARSIARSQSQVYLILAFGTVLLFTFYNYLFLPTQNILFALPLVLFLYFKINSPNSLNFAICFIIVLFFLPALHPLGTMLTCVVLIILNISTLLGRMLSRRTGSTPAIDPYSPIKGWVSVVLVFVLFYIWFSQFNMLDFTVTRAWEALILGERIAPIAGIEEGIGMAYSFFQSLLLRLMLNYGQVILFALLSIIGILILIKKSYSRFKVLFSLEIFFSLYFVILGLFAISTILNPFLGTGSSLRVFCWPLVASVVLNGIVFHDWLLKLTRPIKKLAAGLITIVILASAILGVFNTYFSPIIDSGDAQVTRGEWGSMEWYLANKANYRTFYFDQLPVRAPHLYYGKDAPQPKSVGFYSGLAEHLGYDAGPSLKDTLPMRGYLVITEREMTIKKLLTPNSGSYTLEDLKRVYSDPGADLIYTCQGTDIIFVTK